jgi:hypothetical protein
MLETLKDLRNRKCEFLRLIEDLFLTKALDAIVNTSLEKQERQFSKKKKKSKAYLINIETTSLEGGGIVTDYSV